MSHILVVDSDGVGLVHVLKFLNAAGYRTSGASTFEEARCALADGTPDLVIADERLGAYNGLHVILRARAEHPDVGAIVMTPEKNRGLEADARSLNVQCVLKPQTLEEWLEPISKMFNEDRGEGRPSAEGHLLPSMDRI